MPSFIAVNPCRVWDGYAASVRLEPALSRAAQGVLFSVSFLGLADRYRKSLYLFFIKHKIMGRAALLERAGLETGLDPTRKRRQPV